MKLKLAFAVICLILAIPTYGLSIVILFLAWLLDACVGSWRKRSDVRKTLNKIGKP